MNRDFVYILIPLRSALSAQNWSRVQSLLNNTLKSAINQTNNNFKVLIAVHDIPEIDETIPKEKYDIIKVNYTEPYFNFKDQLIDKYYKKRRLVYEVYKRGNSPFLFLDADDYLSNRIVDYIIKRNKENRDINLLYTSNEWEYDCRYKKIVTTYQIKPIPGPSSVFILPEENLIKEFVFQGYYRNNAYIFDYGHNEWLELFRFHNLKTEPIPFKSAIYLKFNEENHSAYWGEKGSWKRNLIRYILGTRKINKRLRKEFNFWIY